ncbi:hypothetical protein ACFWB2_28385 [Streptomyces virginiae]|uniref:hypothetical protein n=1 Tax=Streptomyces virginiae TaxID=1961 RepID=UPI0036827B5C
MTVAFDAPEDPGAVTLAHLDAVIERGQLSAFEVAPLVRPAGPLTSWVGQGSGCADVSRATWNGRAALHVETAAHPDPPDPPDARNTREARGGLTA